MSCGSTKESIENLEKADWVYAWSFHIRFPDQWNDACDKVEAIQRNGDWEAILLQGQDELEKKDGVAYIYKKKTQQRIQWEKENGYR